VIHATCFRGDSPAHGVPGAHDAASDGAPQEIVFDAGRIGRRARDTGQGNPG